MNITPIKTENDYQAALERMDLLFDAPLNTPESDEADILGLLIDEYENKFYSIEAPDPIEAIKIRMEEMQLEQKDLVAVIGSRSRVSDILNRKRKLTVEMIRSINRQLNISPKVLIIDYELATS
jgi:HTH-type transcriptional regulator/antitoxin HigA